MPKVRISCPAPLCLRRDGNFIRYAITFFEVERMIEQFFHRDGALCLIYIMTQVLELVFIRHDHQAVHACFWNLPPAEFDGAVCDH